MNAATKLFREVRRMMSERLTLIFIAVTVAGTVWYCLNPGGQTASDAYILGAAKNSAFLGALLFMLLTLVQFHRDFKNKTDSIVLTSTDPINHQIRRTLALICVAVFTALIVTLFTLPFAMLKTGDYFQIENFLSSWYLIFLGALIFSILLSSGFYMLTSRVEVAFIAMVALLLMSRTFETQYDLNPCYLFYWVQTNLNSFSDLISNQFQIDMIIWNRLFCMLVSLGVWGLGICGFRRYGRGVFGSLFVNFRRVWIPVLLVTTIALSSVSYAYEPVFDNSIPFDYGADYDSGTGISVSSSGEEEAGNPNLILLNKQADLDVDTESRTVSGKAIYTLKNKTGEAQTLPVSVNSGLAIDKVLINGVEGKAIRGDIEESGSADWSIELAASSQYEVEISYSGHIKNDGSLPLQRPIEGICSEYVWLSTTGFSPSADTEVAEDCDFSGSLSMNDNLEPVFTRATAVKGNTENGKTEWQFSGNPDSQGTSIIAAEYMTKTFEAGGLNVELKYFAKNDKAIADMDAITVMKAAIDYFTETYGPLQYEDNLTMLELPASFGGGFASGNISAMDETSFAAAGYLPSETFSPDSGGGVDVLVHEIAHQWWGLATYPMHDGDSSWSAEGITCYSTYCFMKHYFGAEYANKNYIKEWENSWETYKNAFYIQHPEYLKKLSEKDISNVMASFLMINLYDIMPLMMLKAEDASGGQVAFQQKLSELYKTYLGNYITYDNFLSTIGLTKEALEIA